MATIRDFGLGFYPSDVGWRVWCVLVRFVRNRTEGMCIIAYRSYGKVLGVYVVRFTSSYECAMPLAAENHQPSPHHDTMGAPSAHAFYHRAAHITPSTYTMTVLCLLHTPTNGYYKPLVTHTPQHYQQHWVPTHPSGDAHTRQIQTHPTGKSENTTRILDWF